MLGQDPGDLRRDTSRIQSFLHECRTLGSLRGFKHFEVFMRGREELVLLIPKSHEYKQETSTLMPADVFAQRTMHDQQQQQQQQQPQQEQSPISSSGSSSQGSLMLAERVPVDPKDQELKKLRSNSVSVFLITGYARYKCPYIYVKYSFY
ncbi:hypothetical protein BDB00DRAFT_839719, partial [Zychaea mexicana]|uniref:uncharacterized protein n=1 Tax=Zychaea mexicana TaxID=64656 RepID=UPI0022FDE4A0